MSLLVNKMFLDSMFPPSLFQKDEFEMLNDSFQHEFNKERTYKTQNGYKILIPLAGAAKEDISVKVLDKSVEIKATRKFEEAPVSSYSRYYTINDNIDKSAVTSKYHNGLLLVDLPFKKAKEVSIDVKVQ